MIRSRLCLQAAAVSQMIHSRVTIRSAVVSRLDSMTASFSSATNNHSWQSTREDRPRIRSLLSVPGDDPRKIRKAQGLGADAVVLDLEDGVAHDRKDQARSLVRQTLLDANADFGSSEICVRINGLHAGENRAIHDLEAILRGCDNNRLKTIVVPKVETKGDIEFVVQMMEDCLEDKEMDIRILAAIESAKGFVNLREIAESSSDQLEGLIFASEDYCADVEAIRTPHATEMLYARSQLVITAKAYGLQAIDMVHIHYKDLEELFKESQAGRQLGFTGKQAIHPSQIPVIHATFSPSKKDIQFATDILAAFEETQAAGKGVCIVNGIVVDLPVYKWAVKINEQAKAKRH